MGLVKRRELLDDVVVDFGQIEWNLPEVRFLVVETLSVDGFRLIKSGGRYCIGILP